MEEGIDFSIKHPYEDLTLEERLESLKAGHLPVKEDLEILIKDLERYKALREFAHAAQNARQYLPKDGFW